MNRTRIARALLALALVMLAWALFLALTGGFYFLLGPIRVSSRNPRNSIWVALVSAIALSVISLLPDRAGTPAGSPSASIPRRKLPRQPSALELVRACIVLVVIGSYFSYVFQFSKGTFLHVGLGDWIDPYFINSLLEHWYQSIPSFTDPSSPPMYFPVRGTLGYSHGLILYAPFYLVSRLLFHPFPAYTLALFLVMMTGSLCLYLLFRKFLALGFIESLLLSAFFFSSQNVTNGATSVWSQRASVFLIPPILVIALVSTRIPAGRPRLVLAWLSGLLATLLFTQDFYTGQFALFFTLVLLPPALLLARKASLREEVTGGWEKHGPWIRPFALGGLVGCLVFLSIYLGTYLELQTFPESNLMSSLIARDPSAWRGPLDFLGDLGPYDSMRSFKLVFLLGVLAWVPWLGTDRKSRLYGLWFMAVSLIVIVLPLTFNGFSIWKSVFAPLPGFSAIRDPKRIIQLYELAVVLVAALFLTRLPRKSLFRIAVAVLFLFLLVTERNREVFDFLRPVTVYERWVAAPIEIAPSCEYFFTKGASAEYMSRSPHMWALYGIDSMFVALKHSIPTLNGYSAWAPANWHLANPQDGNYPELVDEWIDQQRLRGVCEFDIDKRQMRPYSRGTRSP